MLLSALSFWVPPIAPCDLLADLIIYSGRADPDLLYCGISRSALLHLRLSVCFPCSSLTILFISPMRIVLRPFERSIACFPDLPVTYGVVLRAAAAEAAAWTAPVSSIAPTTTPAGLASFAPLLSSTPRDSPASLCVERDDPFLVGVSYCLDLTPSPPETALSVDPLSCSFLARDP